MKFILLLSFLMAGCAGSSSIHNELTGQVKKVTNQTPIFCPNWNAVDISLGVMRNGVGSMSTEDLWLTVEKESDLELLQKAADAGTLVKVTYDVRRFSFCTEEFLLTHVERAK